jgi:hypothetical protein
MSDHEKVEALIDFDCAYRDWRRARGPALRQLAHITTLCADVADAEKRMREARKRLLSHLWKKIDRKPSEFSGAALGAIVEAERLFHSAVMEADAEEGWPLVMIQLAEDRWLQPEISPLASCRDDNIDWVALP